MTAIEIIRPDDWHLHLRDGAVLADVVPHTAAVFGRAIIMPNLVPPVTTVAAALAYRERIMAAMPTGARFEPLMTLYLTDDTPPAEIAKMTPAGIVGCKLYPAGATTNSAAGVTRVSKVYPVLEAMQKAELPLLIHGEVVDPEVDVFDREQVFVDRTLGALVRDFPALPIVLEHVTTRDGVDFVRDAPTQVAATITAHHLLLNRNAMFSGGLRPHHYCLPVIKRETHREALVGAATSGNPKFFLGTDSAPHPVGAKESACGCAGVYTAHAAMGLYAEVFERAGALEHLEAFASRNGPRFYRLAPNPDRIRLERQAWTVPARFKLGDSELSPFRASEQVSWVPVSPRDT